MEKKMFQKIRCPAKINLFLEVLGKREDGYHELDTVMHGIDLCDTVGVEVNANGGRDNRIALTCTDPSLPTDGCNIAFRAADAFLRRYRITGADIGIHIEKRIPVAAGLAGGSADCAGVLIALADLFGITDREDLLMLGASLGADVPFCMTCGCAKASGIGDILERVRPLTPEWTLAVAKGGETVSTAQAYAEIDSLPEREYRSSERLVSSLGNGDVCSLPDLMFNRFEEIYEKKIPQIARAKHIMLRCGAIAAMMSGSGPSVFGIFADYEEAERACSVLSEEGCLTFVCLPVM